MSTLPTPILDLIANGRKIEAIKEVRALYGIGLKEAKDLVETVARGETVSLSGFPVPQPETPAPAVEADELAARVFALVQDDQKIQAIKEVRDATGVDLREAKQIVDRVAADASPGLPSVSNARSATPTSRPALFVAIGLSVFLLLLAVLFLLMAA